ncbi:MAG: hypothetical protein RJQ09_15620 [Cyclobacteriaceae bacterium]
MKLLNMLFLLLSLSATAQNFDDFVMGIQEINTPLNWYDNDYLDEDGSLIPSDLFSGEDIDLSQSKAVGKINLQTHWLILIKEYYNEGTDFYIEGLLFKLDGDFCEYKIMGNSAAGDNTFFSISADRKLKIIDSGANDGYLSTFVIENDGFVQLGDSEFIKDVHTFMENEDNP